MKHGTRNSPLQFQYSPPTLSEDTSQFRCSTYLQESLFGYWRYIGQLINPLSITLFPAPEHVWVQRAGGGPPSRRRQSSFLHLQDHRVPRHSPGRRWKALLQQLLHRRRHRLHLRQRAVPLPGKLHRSKARLVMFSLSATRKLMSASICSIADWSSDMPLALRLAERRSLDGAAASERGG